MSRRDDDEQDLLKDPNKRIGDAKGVLAVIFRQFLMVLDIDGWAYDKLMRKWLDNPRNGIPNNSRDRSSARGNLNKELNRDDMTWKVFLKALNFFDPVRISFRVSLTMRTGMTHSVSATLKDRGVVLKVDGGDEPPEMSPGLMDEDETISDLQTEQHRPSLEHPIRRANTNKQPADLVSALRRAPRKRSED